MYFIYCMLSAMLQQPKGVRTDISFPRTGNSEWKRTRNINLGNNYITLLLDRKNDGIDPFKGEMTMGEIIPGFENITSMPRLDVETVTRLLKSDQHWQALTDENNGIIGPDGQPIKFDSIVPRAPDGQLVAVIDSGFTFSQVPRDIADAIYGRVKSAVYDATNEWWLLPCGQYLNISFNFGGRNYPVHPLDVVDDNFSKIDSTGKKVCIGSFQPITSAFSLLGHYDMILGMNFRKQIISTPQCSELLSAQFESSPQRLFSLQLWLLDREWH